MSGEPSAPPVALGGLSDAEEATATGAYFDEFPWEQRRPDPDGMTAGEFMDLL